MIKSAIARTPILVFILMFVAVGYTIAHNKVVIVPLGSTEPTLDIFYGSITLNGILEAGNFESAIRSATGVYTVNIGRQPSGCSAVASAGWLQPNGNYQGRAILSAEVNTSHIEINSVRHNTGSDVFVKINTDFHLMVMCPKA